MKKHNKERIKFVLAMLKHIADEDYEPVNESYSLAAARIAQDAINVLKEIKPKKNKHEC